MPPFYFKVAKKIKKTEFSSKYAAQSDRLTLLFL